MGRNNIVCYNIWALTQTRNSIQQKKGGKRIRTIEIVFCWTKATCVCVRSTKWDARQECKAIRRMHTGAFCGATKPTLLTTTTSEAKKYPHRQSRRVYPVERGNAAILRRHSYYLLLTMMVLRLPIQIGDSSSKARVSISMLIAHQI